MGESMQCADLYLRRVDPSGKRKPFVTHHRVWDAHRFIAAQQAEAAAVSAKTPGDAYRIEVASREEFDAQFRR